MVFEVPGGAGDHGMDGLRAALGVHGIAGPLLGREGGEPFGGPAAEGVDDGDEAAEGVVAARGVGGAAAIEPGIDEGVLVPEGEHGAVFSDGAAHAVREGEFGVGEVSNQNANRPAAHAGIGQKRLVGLGIREFENSAVEAFEAAAVA